jgi:hypothetical protein
MAGYALTIDDLKNFRVSEKVQNFVGTVLIHFSTLTASPQVTQKPTTLQVSRSPLVLLAKGSQMQLVLPLLNSMRPASSTDQDLN